MLPIAFLTQESSFHLKIDVQSEYEGVSEQHTQHHNHGARRNYLRVVLLAARSQSVTHPHRWLVCHVGRLPIIILTSLDSAQPIFIKIEGEGNV